MRVRKTNKWAKVVIPCPNCGCGCDVELGDSDEDEIISISSDSEPEPKRPRRDAAAKEPASPTSSLDIKIEPKEEPPSQSNIQAFFSQYSTFEYNPSQPVMSEFERMCKIIDFKPFKSSQAEARKGMKDAMTKDFNALYGTDVNDLGAWQSLCRVLQFPTIPDNLVECQELVQATHVNIVDLVDTKLTGDPVIHFNSERELSIYTKSTRKFFPRDNINAGNLLRFLLRHIFCPTDADRSKVEPLLNT
ncbi:hypothetical protein CTheo_3427 [Ceratobasidium theobromae]|uniref:Uncharacterized protein n=1 Tax=Ceratobasidium theobromae TaxID=1582974 RepID=A0A5N5QMW8_9AGAM|nr:hypothetical protein CTheo_3427 [Ceratobasidium theobromae]